MSFNSTVSSSEFGIQDVKSEAEQKSEQNASLCKAGTLKFRINDLFVYSGHFVIQKGRGNIVFLF